MRVIRIENLKDDMVLARPLFQKHGIVLLNEGATNLVRYKEKFKQMGIFYLYVEDDESRGIEIDDVVKQETRNEGRRVVGEMLKKLLNKQRIHINEIQDVVTSIIDDILTNKTVIVNLTDLKNTDDYLYGHAVNVSVLALIIGHAKGYSDRRVSRHILDQQPGHKQAGQIRGTDNRQIQTAAQHRDKHREGQ